jgi:hypothetical protein
LTEDEHRDGRETVSVINSTEDERCDHRETDQSSNNESNLDEMEQDEFVFPKPIKVEKGKFY